MTDKHTLDLARQWAADIDADRETLSQDTIDAAADLISSLPESWVGADTLRKYISDWREGLATAPRGNYEAEMLDDLEDMLPAPKPRTLADIPPEEQEACRGMQAEVLGMKMWLIVGKDPTREGWWIVTTRSGRTEFRPSLHIVPLPELPRMQWPGSEPEETHFDDLPDEVKQVMEESVEDYKAGRFVDFDTPESAPKPATPRTEDVPVGEPWQVEIDGRAAIGYRNDPKSRLSWTVVSQDDGTGRHWVYDSDVTLIARLVPETTEQDDEPEFDPAYTYRDRDGDEWPYVAGGWRWGGDVFSRPHSAPPAKHGPYTRIEA